MVIKGSCACGKVQYRVDGDLHDASSCHCSMCRKSSGSSSTAFAFFQPGTFSWVSGESNLGHYQSSPDMGSFFCGLCGSPLAGAYKGEVGWVALGSVDGHPNVKVEKHIFMASRASWETVPDQVKQYSEFPE